MPILRPAFAYAATIFAAGFLLGTLRAFWIAPALGPLPAVALELPVMLALSWIVAGRILARQAIPPGAGRLGFGTLAFALLMTAELALGHWGFGQDWSQIAAAYLTAPGLLGLAGQLGFALIPLLHP